MKAVLVFFFALLPVIAVASGKRVATATGPRGGNDKVKFDVKTDRSQHPSAKPEPGKTLVYFLQDDSHFLSVPKPTTPAEAGNSYFFIVRDRFVEDRGPAEKTLSPLDSDEGQLLLRSVWLQHLSPQEMN